MPQGVAVNVRTVCGTSRGRVVFDYGPTILVEFTGPAAGHVLGERFVASRRLVTPAEV